MSERSIQIVAFRDEHARAFAQLNRDWLDAFDLYEEADGKHLYTPRETILAIGGEIFIAEQQGRVIGSVALLPASEGEWEIAKLAVSPDARGSGLGRRLAALAIERARACGAVRVVLSSSSKLKAALKLYASLGFEHKVPPMESSYETADVYMVLELGRSRSPRNQ